MEEWKYTRKLTMYGTGASKKSSMSFGKIWIMYVNFLIGGTIDNKYIELL